MKRWIQLIVYVVVISLLVPGAAEAKLVVNDRDVKGVQSHRNFATANGSQYYINDGFLQNEVAGIYKVSKDLTKYRLLVAGNYSSISIYNHTIITFNEDKEMLQQRSLEGKHVKDFPHVQSNEFTIDGNLIYYSTVTGLYYIGVNGKGRTLLHEPNGLIQEFTVHNGWLYFTYAIPKTNDPYEMDFTMNLSKIKIFKPTNEIVLQKNVNNIDSIIVRNGYIYAVIHRNEAEIEKGRPLYRMDYSGKQLARMPVANSSAIFIGPSHFYYVDNTFNAREKLFRVTMDGKHVRKIGELRGRKATAEYHDGVFYFNVQQNATEQTFLERVRLGI